MSKLVPDLELPPLFEKADRAMKEAVAAAVAEHWRAGRPVHIWKDDKSWPCTRTEPAFLRARPASGTTSAEAMLRQGAAEGLPPDIEIELPAGDGEVEGHPAIEEGDERVQQAAVRRPDGDLGGTVDALALQPAQQGRR